MNTGSAEFESYLYDDIFVDKSLLIKTINNNLTKKNIKYMCITRMRRSGKSLAIAMLNAYYSRGCDSKEQFKNLKISKDESYETHLNKHNVIWIDLTGGYCDIRDKNDFLKELEESVLDDLKDSYEDILTDEEDTISKCLRKINSITEERFIIFIDEWDIIFREQEENRELGYKYLEYLNQTFTSSDVSDCIDLVYMTGIYPIKRYTDKSTLSMFK